MTNKMLIYNAAAQAGVDEPVNTYQGWQRMGLQVKKGSKALFKTKIWKPCKLKGKAEAAADRDGEEAPEGDEKLILVDACFFGLSQVEKKAASA